MNKFKIISNKLMDHNLTCNTNIILNDIIYNIYFLTSFIESDWARLITIKLL